MEIAIGSGRSRVAGISLGAHVGHLQLRGYWPFNSGFLIDSVRRS